MNINGKNIKFESTDNLTNVIQKINSAPGANVTASFDELSGKFKIQAKDFGATNNIKLVDATGNPITSSFLNLIGTSTVHAATNAKVTVTNTNDNSSKVFEPESNTLLVNGVQLTLQTTNEGDPTLITSQTDPTKAMETIKGFVDTYNELIKTFSSKLGEEKYRTFTPLSDEQKKDMKENDIKLWEESQKWFAEE